MKSWKAIFLGAVIGTSCLYVYSAEDELTKNELPFNDYDDVEKTRTFQETYVSNTDKTLKLGSVDSRDAISERLPEREQSDIALKETIAVQEENVDEEMVSNEAPGNETQTKNSTSTNDSDSKVTCVKKKLENDEVPQVQLVNSSTLIDILTPAEQNDSECVVVLFYSPWCVFSAKAAPHFNALARIFPYIHFLALDTATYSGLNMRYGLVGVPTVLLFHKGKPIVKFNGSEAQIENFAVFVTKYTGMSPEDGLNITSADMMGPVPTQPAQRTDFVLILAWMFTLGCLCTWFLRSSLWQRIVECVRNTWREAEAQHEHVD
ncbi:thioredoxin domain-containing protein 15-like [Limulus polyphemus]|uniref:Thioredoxin domain-containing protein 15-like n=1 Tax=Limulus polyphemus TaxID=6850 RepID=A0ABM1B9Q0_LIMPO|nr:thioredoxin domain-containing protein 15-like [Limulus polyphemus]XP_013777666.1 thioredoxin domain-containing protein 15-like [Limulus polyphemus]